MTKYIISVLLLTSCSQLTGPKFKVGDCNQTVREKWEKEAPENINKIVEIGKDKYLFAYKYNPEAKKEFYMSASIEQMDKEYYLVECPEYLK